MANTKDILFFPGRDLKLGKRQYVMKVRNRHTRETQVQTNCITTHTSIGLLSNFLKEAEKIGDSELYIHSHVNKLLLCKQIELNDDEFNIDEKNLKLTIVSSGFEINHDEYILTSSSNARICFNKFKMAHINTSSEILNSAVGKDTSFSSTIERFTVCAMKIF
jgi:hypothetical protein